MSPRKTPGKSSSRPNAKKASNPTKATKAAKAAKAAKPVKSPVSGRAQPVASASEDRRAGRRPRRPSDPLHILMLASEAAPFSKTGGLADVTSSLARALGRMGHVVTL